MTVKHAPAIIRLFGIILILAFFTPVLISAQEVTTYDPERDVEPHKPSLFPLMKNIVPEGYELPRPYGIGFIYYTQNQGFTLDNVQVGGFEVSDLIQNIRIDDSPVHLFGINLDTWVLPFLNIFVAANYGLGNAYGEFTLVGDDGMALLIPGWPAGGTYERGFIDYEFKMFTLGPGAVLAFGWNNIFVTASVGWWYIWRTEGADTTAAMFMPRVGYDFGPVRAWIGAMYQSIPRVESGTIDPGGANLDYKVELNVKDEWNYLIGMQFPLDKKGHWEMVVEGGIGDRWSFTTNVVYRMGEAL